jgi:signal transduction histidine kinase
VKASVRSRLTVWFSVVFFCGVGVLGVCAYFSVRASCFRVLDNELSIRADGVEGFLKEHITRLSTSRLQSELSVHAALKPAYLIVQDPSGAPLYCGNAVSSICSASVGNGSSSTFVDQQFRILSVTRMVHGFPYTIRVASDLSFQTAILHHFFYWLLIVAPVALISSALGGYWLSGRALRPVKEIINEVQAIEEQSLSTRLIVPKTGDEIQVLSETVNGMLDRIERAFRQVKEITTNASHELRTPISVIRASAEIALLNARPTVESHRQALVQICAEAEKNTRLLDGLLMLARVESGVQPPHFARLPFCKSVKQAVEACRNLAETKRIALSFHADCEDVQLWGDAGHLKRLWIILLDNAIKYTPYGGRVAARILLNMQNEPVCEIRDNGIGVKPEELPYIFERFVRSERAKRSGVDGYGLGLAIARKIVDAHHASIDVSSADESGTVFRVKFNENTSIITAEAARSDGSDKRALTAS